MNGELTRQLTALPVEESGLTTLSLSVIHCVLTPDSGKWSNDAVSLGDILAGTSPTSIYNEDFARASNLLLSDEHGVKPRLFAAGTIFYKSGSGLRRNSHCQRICQRLIKH